MKDRIEKAKAIDTISCILLGGDYGNIMFEGFGCKWEYNRC